ncbi:VTT domain-containing protein [Sanguibacter inulinus]|uniref:VTT domain-containing protein n=1 Tax=Sanguibacter inulinus TaxID=60922 RepID=A0A853EUJ4_9MICO|nr:VTT domain-containing protein [Sanguibacter inulinus]MBF0723084.1 VTT domain-containing protein [Sanguibacter inulinus]NYS94229.1 VTT domain-containing protein [Sanguibacter inulinus]
MISADILASAGEQVVALGPDWLNADSLIASFGGYALVGICLVIFVETGLLFPFLPGDSLLFTAGMLVAQEQLDFPLWLLCIMLFLAAFAGDQCSYLIGRKVGPKIFNKPDSRFFKQSYIEQTNAFFDKYGGRALILARFAPFVRTYAPVAAGVGRMPYRHFVSYNVIGAFLWGVGITVLGYFLGQISFVHDNIELILVAIVFVSVLPIVVELGRGWLGNRKAAAAAAATGPATAPDGLTAAAAEPTADPAARPFASPVIDPVAGSVTDPAADAAAGPSSGVVRSEAAASDVVEGAPHDDKDR